MFFSDSEAILGRIHEHLSRWRAGRPGAESMVARAESLVAGGESLAAGAESLVAGAESLVAGAESLLAIGGEFRALKAGAADAGFADISELSHSVENLIAQSGDTAGADDVALLNLLEEIHDGLVADMGFVPAASRDHVRALDAMVRSLLIGDGPPDASEPTPAESPQPARPARRPPPTPVASPARPPIKLSVCLSQLRHIAAQAAEARGVQVNVSLTGDDREVDQRVVDCVLESLGHLIRGSIAHGIQSAGRIDITLAQQGALTITYTDDGRGFDREALAARAVETGMTDHADEVGEAHLLQILARRGDPQEVDSQAGGVAEACRAVRELGGLMAVKSEKDAGVCVQIQLPANPDAGRALLVTAAGYRFAIPAHTIARVMRVPADEVPQRAGRRYLTLDGGQVPVVALPEQVQVRVRAKEARPARSTVLLTLIRLGDRLAAFEVDGFHDLVTLVAGVPGAQLATIRGIAGVGVLADGERVLMLDPDGFIDRGVLEHHGLIRFPFGDGDGNENGNGNGNGEGSAQAEAQKTLRVVVLETTLGPLVIPVGKVAGIAVGGESLPQEHPWICGAVHWQGAPVPVIHSATALGGDATEARPWRYAVILESVTGAPAGGRFALTGDDGPRVMDMDARSAPKSPEPPEPPEPPTPNEAPDNVLGYIALDRRAAMIPDLEKLARGIFP